MNILSYAKTDSGKQRNYNEDFMLADPALGLFIVCDGMGGHAAGDVASRTAATTTHRVVGEMTRGQIGPGATQALTPERMVQILRTAIETACQTVYDEGVADIAKRGMGSTCTAVFVHGGKAVMGHVGDSRLYMARGGAATQLSEDHSFIAEAVKQGIFTAEEASEFAYRNVITRAIGKDRTVIVDTLTFDVVAGDTLLLCSDGLHQYTKDMAELGRLLSVEDAENLPARLVALANERGGSDNVTTLIVRGEVDASDAAGSQRATDVRANLDTLKRVELMHDLGMAEIVRLNQIFQEVHYPAGTLMVQEGDVSDGLFVIVQGTAEVLRSERRVAVLPAGAHFGEMSLLSSKPRSASVRALENARVLFVDRARLYGFLQQDGMLAAKIFWKLAKTLAARLDQANEKQDELSQALATASAQKVSGYYSR